VVVSDDPLVRGGLSALLQGEPALDVIGQGPASDLPWDEADVAVWDGAPSAFEQREREARAVPAVVVLRDDGQAAPVLTAGARAVLARDVAGERLAAAVRAAAQGLLVLDPALAESLLRGRAPLDPPLETLTARELEVLQLLAEGLSNKRVAARLAISEHTAKFHVNSILGKLGAQSRAEAVALALRQGLILL